MHNYPPFEMKSEADKCAFIEGRRFGMIIVNSGAVPAVAHVPMILIPGDPLVIEGHVARSNPVAALLKDGPAEALAVFNGPDAYVSAGFYPSKLRHGRVAPTWNYVAVHASGRLTSFREADQLVDHLARLSDHLEREQTRPWALSDAPEGFTDRLVPAITGFRLEVSQLDGIRKLSQNSRPEDRAGVLSALAASPAPGDAAIHAEMTRDD